jgi:tRNA-dihydrouridine synthase B
MSGETFSWSTAKPPVVALAPMSGVSDIAMRVMAKRFGSDLLFSEFISAASLFYKPDNEKSFALARFLPEERPFIIQLFGNAPEHFRVAASILAEKFHPDGFDVNFGCPARSVVNSGAGSSLFLQPSLAKEIIQAVKEASGNLPTSIKLRAAYKHVSVLEFIRAIADAPFENVTLHMRTYEQLHTGEPNWDSAKQLKALLREVKDVPLIINGGLNSPQKCLDALAYTGAQGVMVAQASLGNPFIFAEIKAALAGEPVPTFSYERRVAAALDHAKIMAATKGEKLGMLEMRKHLAWYFKGYPNVSELRAKLVHADTLADVEGLLAT